MVLAGRWWGVVVLMLLNLSLISPKLFAEEPQQVLNALVRAYPQKITGVALRDGDWSILIDGQVYYWAEGRMLSAEERSRAEDFSPYSFHPYPDQVPPVRELNASELSRLEQVLSRREAKKDLRHPGFLWALWGMESFALAEQTVHETKFLGHTVRVHPELVDALVEVEQELIAAADQYSTLASWVEELGGVGGYVWRDIAGSANRSMHSYGIAIDLIPKDYGEKQAYWRWTRSLYKEWWTIPHTQRYRMPQLVVETFEKHGFIWGGKWLFFDQIHFEYRPELILLKEIEDRAVTTMKRRLD